MDKLVYLEVQGKMDVMELKVLKETWVQWVLLDLKDLLDKEDPSMSGGGRTHALIHQEQKLSTLDLLLGLTTVPKEVGQTTYLCLPQDPKYSKYHPGVQGYIPLYGAEYQTYTGGPLSHVFQHNVPCAVCCTTRSKLLMIPAKSDCPTNWTLEYNGYLMTERFNNFRNSFECVDKDPDSIPGSAANTNGALFYHVEATCNGIHCPPYDPQKELTCAVCTKLC